jgi:hypothetical protein
MWIQSWQHIREVELVPSLVVAMILNALGFIAFAVSFVAMI